MAKCNCFHVLFLILASLLFSSSMLWAGDDGQFTGTWSANGTRNILKLGNENSAATFTVSGHVNLDQPVGGETDFWSRCIGLSDSNSGMQARCVWRSLSGLEIYISLHSPRFAQGGHVTGEIVGGSANLQDINGSLSFDWETMVIQRENLTSAISGYARNLQGSYSLAHTKK